MSRSAVLKAFSPAHEITEPRLFAGRTEQIAAIADGLRTPGSCPILYGDRGLGKSSLALQAQLVAMGGTELLTAQGLSSHILNEDETFLTFYTVCSDEVTNVAALVQRLINQLNGVDFDTAGRTADTHSMDRTTRKKVSLKVVEAEVTRTFKEKSPKVRPEDLSPTEQFVRLSRALVEARSAPLLFIVDEIDRMKDLTGLSSFIKAVSSHDLKLLLVGIAQSVSDLVADHQSVSRSTIPIRVPRMKKGELADIMDRALDFLNDQGYSYKFENAARIRLVNYANGFPWFIHVIGQSALLAAYEDGVKTVTDDMLITSTRALMKNRFAQQFSDMYQQAVRDSIHREITLRAFASWQESDIPTADVYNVARRLGVTNPSIYKRHLSSEEYGNVLMAPPYQRQGLVRFRNEMFKQYVNLRSSLFRGVDEKVREAT